MNSSNSSNPMNKTPHLDWLDPLKAFALLAILLNHLVEEFGSGPWFTNPTNNWPNFATRMSRLFPQDYSSPIISLLQFFGWLGDSGPGVFILVSGMGLTWAALHRPAEESRTADFYRRRLIRIFPLYIAMHFVILVGSLLVPGNKQSLADPRTLLSMLGLRFTDSLFFYISPAWWFVWLVIQLYLIFPFLLRLLNRVGIRWFLVITFGATFAARLYGILYSKSLYYWMTGIFFGTRLAEFSAGMAIAALLYRSYRHGSKIPGTGRVFALSFGVYILGLICSFTLPGSIFSNLLVTLGMSGLLYTVWKILSKRFSSMARVIVWIGVESYAIFLLHQTPLKWTTVFENQKVHLAAALLVLLLSFPVGWLINRVVTKVPRLAKELETATLLRITSLILAIGVGFALLFVEPRLWVPWEHRFFSLILGLCVVSLVYIEYIRNEKEAWLVLFLRWSIICASLFQLFLFPVRSGFVTLALGFLMGAAMIVAYWFVRPRALAWMTGAAAALFLMVILELGLAHYVPLEAGRWGELPALQVHPTRVFALKPNQVTRLKYNNYDYIMKTNSLGLASPEISIERPTIDTLRVMVVGDAFSMPEGMEYEYSYPALLEKQLAESWKPRKVQVINAGVTGYGPVEEYTQLRELAPLFKPDIVICEFFINEFEDVLKSREGRLKTIGLIASNNSIRLHLLERSQIMAHGQQLYDRLKEIRTKKPSERRYTKSLLQFYQTGGNRLYSEESISKVRLYLESMNEFCQEIGSRLVIYFVPGAVAVSRPSDIAYFPWDQDLSDQARYDLDRPLRSLRMIADPLKILVVDLTPYLRKHSKQPVYFPESWHWNKEGHQVVARVISETLANIGYLPSKTAP